MYLVRTEPILPGRPERIDYGKDQTIGDWQAGGFGMELTGG